MKLLEPRVWSAFDIVCLKWSSILFGVIIGAFFAEIVVAHVWVFVAGIVLLAMRPVFAYFNPRNRGGNFPNKPAGVSQ